MDTDFLQKETKGTKRETAEAAAGTSEPVSRGARGEGAELLTRGELGLALRVSPRTVDRMLADGEITPVRLRGKLVRFSLPDVMRELRAKAETSKRNVARRV